jgi:sensor histidine kinase regulating citrate/malate metabolism
MNAMISYKAEQLREYGAAFSVSAELLDIPEALTHDIASVLAIALDNAIDAVALIEETEALKNAAVHCRIRRRRNLLFIKVSNPLVHPLTYRNGELQTIKNKPGPDSGLPALRRIVERYDGEVKISDKDGIFLLQVMLVV